MIKTPQVNFSTKGEDKMQTEHTKSVRLLKAKDVMAIVGFSRATLWRLSKSGGFPRQLQTSPGTVRWRENEVMNWLANLQHAI